VHLGTAHVGDRAAVVVRDGEQAAVLPTEHNVLELIADWPARRDSVAYAIRSAQRVDPAALSWLPPIPRPGAIVCLALNNSANRDRIHVGPDHPATFVKPTSSLVGHGQPIRLRPEYGRVHPEPELAVVIGRRASAVAARDAMEHVFGYTIVNDLTSPTMRGEDTFHYRAIHPGADGEPTYIDSWVSYPGRYKGADTFCPMGPWIATRDEIDDPHALRIRCSHRGRLITEDTTANLRWHTAEALEFISSYQTLEPGDVVSLGTALRAAGSGTAVQTVDLNQLGGPVEVDIEGIGALSNPVQWR
jgi:2-keto-4-pentenoate hydratase/2-oxohepta-3-ene-1,7-dioic acid hydratase in catechol pathway